MLHSKEVKLPLNRPMYRPQLIIRFSSETVMFENLLVLNKLFTCYFSFNQSLMKIKIDWQETNNFCTLIVPHKIKKPLQHNRSKGFITFKSAQNRNRTCTSLRTLDFESSASTNSAIWAGVQYYIIHENLPKYD